MGVPMYGKSLYSVSQTLTYDLLDMIVFPGFLKSLCNPIRWVQVI